uniref:Uncharacterized protein n=1 Tax=Myotis myotis TaxID=51298 RepID=A0A7J7WHA2_MYOMY|nr:hypothetical protein mMyoMyo1_012026 [Myotis myotis]
MWWFGLLRSPPPLLLLLPQLGLGLAASRSQAGTMDLGGCGSARSCPAAQGRPGCLRLSAVPGSDPQRSNELLLLAAEGPERRDLSGDRAQEEPPLPPQHHVVYFAGDVQAFAHVSRLLSQCKFDLLEELVTKELLLVLKEKVTSLPDSHRDALAADMDEIVYTSTGDISIYYDDKGFRGSLHRE